MVIHQVIFSGHITPDISKQVKDVSVEKIYNYCKSNSITGLKLYTDGTFFCIVEGVTDAIQTLEMEYQKHPRISNCVTLLNKSVEKAEFEGFKMGFTKNDGPLTAQYSFVLTSQNLSTMLPQNMSESAGILIKTFIKVNNIPTG